MAQFRATIQGQRGQASRLGSKKSGLVADINGWHNGVRVLAEYDEKNGTDVFVVYKTGGSSYGEHEKICTISNGRIVLPVFP